MKNIYSLRYIYSKLPSSLKRGYSYYSKTRRLISETESFSKMQIEDWQYKKLVEIVNYAWDNIEGYRELWSQGGFHPSKLRSISDINSIPFVTKEILRDNIDKFTNKKLSNLKYITTGGSSGVPFGFYQQKHNFLIEKAFINDHWSRFYNRINLNTKRVILRGERVPGILRYDPIDGLILSSYEINEKNVKIFINEINKTKFLIFHAYPSAIYLMAKVMKDHSLKIEHHFGAIMLGSEPLYSFQRELIEEVFDTEICFWYGHTEKAIFAGNCKGDNNFHIYPQYGLCECITSNNEQATSGEIGELVGTSFWNYATPFVRYRTADYAKIQSTGCSLCQREYQTLSNIEGRLQEFIVTKTQKLISMTAINMHDNIFDDIMQFRFVQHDIGRVTFNFIAKRNKRVDLDFVYNGLKGKLTDDVDLEMEEVVELGRTKSGKMSFLEQYIDVNEFI